MAFLLFPPSFRSVCLWDTADALDGSGAVSVVVGFLNDLDPFDGGAECVVHDTVAVNVVGEHDVLTAVLGDKKRIAVLVLAEAVSFRDGDDRSGGRSTVRIRDRP